MEQFSTEIQVRWSDLDPNFHLRHSVYYDWGALCRIEFLYKLGLTTDIMAELHFGPILFREECIFKREIQLSDRVKIDLKLLKSKRDFSRWTIQHLITKNEDTLSATLTCDGAWIDTNIRKLAAPPEKASSVFSQMPKHEKFEWID